jgi:hypothetical protein
MMMAVFVDVRVAGQLSYVPAHFKNGKEISSRVEIPVYANSNRGAKTGEAKKSDPFKLVVWGKLADGCCKSLPSGKALSVFAEQDPYIGRLFDEHGNVRNDSTGMPIMVPKMSFTVTKLKYGKDSAKEIATEIQNGRRPMNWNVPNHPDWALWVKILTDRQAKTWDCRSPEFEFARIVMPQGQGIIINYAYYAAKAGAAPAGGFNQNLPNMVANAFGAKFDAMTGQPIVQNPAPLFDAMTGRPLAPLPLFDAMTGKPLNATPQPVSYDPQTGMPIYGSRNEFLAAAGSGFPSTPSAPPVPAAGTALF